MNVLSRVLQEVHAQRSQGVEPLVVLDVDDTLIDCRHRKLVIMSELARDAKSLERFPAFGALLQLQLSAVQYRIEHTLQKVGLTQEELIQAAHSFWRDRNFTNAYLRHDRPFAGAVAYVNSLVQAGATIVYLTARADEDMGEGTRFSLKSHNFPITGPHRIWLKPEREQNDFLFKELAMRDLAKNHHVVALFENEIPHLNLAADIFPHSHLVWFDTLYAPNPPPPHPRIERVQGYESI